MTAALMMLCAAMSAVPSNYVTHGQHGPHNATHGTRHGHHNATHGTRHGQHNATHGEVFVHLSHHNATHGTYGHQNATESVETAFFKEHRHSNNKHVEKEHATRAGDVRYGSKPRRVGPHDQKGASEEGPREHSRHVGPKQHEEHSAGSSDVGAHAGAHHDGYKHHADKRRGGRHAGRVHDTTAPSAPIAGTTEAHHEARSTSASWSRALLTKGLLGVALAFVIAVTIGAIAVAKTWLSGQQTLRKGTLMGSPKVLDDFEDNLSKSSFLEC